MCAVQGVTGHFDGMVLNLDGSATFPACSAVAHTQTASGKAAHKLEAETEDFHREWLLVRGTAEEEEQQQRQRVADLAA